MLTPKNYTPGQLSALTALVLSTPIALMMHFFTPTWWVSLIMFAVIFIISYVLILFTLQNFIYRKIKLIYKLIYSTKASRKEEFYFKNILPQKSIEEVRQDVEEWAVQKTEEINVLRQNEAFRKDFLQNLSHELKTPIFAIQGYLETLQNGAINNPNVNEKFVANASRNADRLVSLLKDLDEISKLESGVFTLTLTPFVIQDLVKYVVDSLEIKFKEKEIRYQVKKGCDAPLTVVADKERIKQVIINLVENSIKYGRKNGMVESSFYRMDSKTVLVELSDNGHGIAEEHVSRVFERFYRTDTARSRNIGGSGLGLSICKHIIEAHGHNMHIRSTLDVGTTVGFTLPAK